MKIDNLFCLVPSIPKPTKNDISTIDKRTVAQIERNYKKKTEKIFHEKDLDILLALGRSFASYDRERTMIELCSHDPDIDKENTIRYKWEGKEFDRNKMLKVAKDMEGEQVRCI